MSETNAYDDDPPECARCGQPTEPDLVRAYEDGGLMQCSRCGLDLDEPSPAWCRRNGYNPPGELDEPSVEW